MAYSPVLEAVAVGKPGLPAAGCSLTNTAILNNLTVGATLAADISTCKPGLQVAATESVVKRHLTTATSEIPEI